MNIWRFSSRRRGNPCRQTTAALAAACGILCAGTCGGQAIDRSELERCAALHDDQMKLACYEQLTASDDEAVDRGSVPAADAPATKRPAPAVEAAGMPEAGAEAAAESAGATRDAAVDELGSEQVKAQAGASPLVVEVTIAKVTRDRLDRLYFHFDNGQVWRQIESRRFRYPQSGEFQAIVSTGMMGEFRLRLSEDEPMTRIRRIE